MLLSILPRAEPFNEHTYPCDQHLGFMEASGQMQGVQLLWAACQVWLFAVVCTCKDLQLLGCSDVNLRDTMAFSAWQDLDHACP